MEYNKIFVWQIIMVNLTAPINFILSNGGDNVMSAIATVLRLIIPLIMMGIVFGRQNQGKGVDFKFKRFCIASLFWIVGWCGQTFFLFDEFSSAAMILSHRLNIEFARLDSMINVLYDIVVLSGCVLLSYKIGRPNKIAKQMSGL